MVRETSAANSRHGTMYLGAGKGASFQYRANNGGTSAGDNGDSITTIPRWIRVRARRQHRARLLLERRRELDAAWHGHAHSPADLGSDRRGVHEPRRRHDRQRDARQRLDHDGHAADAGHDCADGADEPAGHCDQHQPDRSDAGRASTDTGGSGLAGYRIFRNGGATPIATVTTTSYSDTGLAASTQYTYTVRAVDGANNVSAELGVRICDDAVAAGAGYHAAERAAESAGHRGRRGAHRSELERVDRQRGRIGSRGLSHLSRWRRDADRDGHDDELQQHEPDGEHELQLPGSLVRQRRQRIGVCRAARRRRRLRRRAGADGDIGAVAAAGSFTDNGASLSITGSGADIWGTADEFQFAYRPLTGDGDVDGAHRRASRTATCGAKSA